MKKNEIKEALVSSATQNAVNTIMQIKIDLIITSWKCM